MPFPIPPIFGELPGQIGRFEIRKPCPADGPLIVNHFVPGISISWTSAWPSAPTNYRIREAEFPSGPWTHLADVPGTNAQMSFALPPSASVTRFYLVEGTNASPAQPLGSWLYQALDKSGAMLAFGTLTFTSSVPLLGSCNFTRQQNFMPHPAGTNAFSLASMTGLNVVEVAVGHFGLRGPMLGDYWAGYWFAEEPIGVIGGNPQMLRHGGRFMARRCGN
jgi:hypothetical protein